jgi:hypothetical protein
MALRAERNHASSVSLRLCVESSFLPEARIHRPSVGITYSAPRRAPPGQRCVTAL